MKPRTANTRPGATLVELLVVMSVIAALGALAVMLLPSIANQDATLKGAAEVQTTLKISQAMASSARLPRGVRLLYNPNLPGTLCTEMQYLESPPVMVADPNVLVAKPGDTTGVNTANGPRVELSYEYYDGNTAALPNSGWTLPGNPPAGAIKRRHCYITGLNSDQEAQIAYGATIVLPTLGAWSRLTDNPPGSGTASTVVNANPRTLEVYLEVYPDALLGAAANDPTSNLLYRTYHFGIYGPPVPVLGEPTVPLPKNIAIDFAVSLVPYAGTPGRNYDVLFAPSGQMISTYGTSGGINGTGALYLWVRDYTKVPTMVQSGAALAAAFRQGGEQQVVAVRNGFIGAAPVNWPDSSGNFDPFALARQRLD